MIDFYPILRPLLMAMEPEKAHRLAITALKILSFPRRRESMRAIPTMDPRLRGDDMLGLKLWGYTFKNPVGLAAGFDKDAEVIAQLFGLGFGFVEVGTVTPKPQPGNPKPRVFRDIANESVINRMGFPGKGLAYFTQNILSYRKRYPQGLGILGANIGINKDTPSPVDDYRRCLETLTPFVDYITINVSSPNTAGLRNLQAREDLDKLLSVLKCDKPLLLKIAPDLEPAQRVDIAELALQHRLSGLVISNTTVSRPANLAAHLQGEKGGLSGRLLTSLSTEVIRDFYQITGGQIPIIGVGGIASAEDAYAKIKAGATLLQVYTALTYQGPALVTRITEGLVQLLQRDGFNRLSDAVGIETDTGKRAAKAVT